MYTEYTGGIRNVYGGTLECIRNVYGEYTGVYGSIRF